ncbi:MAG: MTH1187 family thiamine-binding protein [Deltaproteobacteria bacterium]|nr:MTH1187 family thiamine-binding protein [Deltaproteobacteria bacterium]
MSVVAEFSIFPIGRDVGVAPYVARVLKIIRKSDLDYELNPMGTCMEGELDRILAVVAECFRDLETDCDRVYGTLKIDSRRDGSGRLKGKVSTVQQLMDNEEGE